MEQLKAAQASEAELKKQLDDAQKNLSTVNNKVENSITQVVSVLSIFAAIVIAFSGGISFLGNVVSSIQNVIIYKSVLICILCGLILFNIVFLMLYVVGKIINRSIFAYCAEEDSNSSSGSLNYQCAGVCAKKCSGFNRVRKRLPYVFWVNTVGLGLCLLNIIAWFMRLNNIWPLDF